MGKNYKNFILLIFLLLILLFPLLKNSIKQRNMSNNKSLRVSHKDTDIPVIDTSKKFREKNKKNEPKDDVLEIKVIDIEKSENTNAEAHGPVEITYTGSFIPLTETECATSLFQSKKQHSDVLESNRMIFSHHETSQGKNNEQNEDVHEHCKVPKNEGGHSGTAEHNLENPSFIADNVHRNSQIDDNELSKNLLDTNQNRSLHEYESNAGTRKKRTNLDKTHISKGQKSDVKGSNVSSDSEIILLYLSKFRKKYRHSKLSTIQEEDEEEDDERNINKKEKHVSDESNKLRTDEILTSREGSSKPNRHASKKTYKIFQIVRQKRNNDCIRRIKKAAKKNSAYRNIKNLKDLMALNWARKEARRSMSYSLLKILNKAKQFNERLKNKNLFEKLYNEKIGRFQSDKKKDIKEGPVILETEDNKSQKNFKNLEFNVRKRALDKARHITSDKSYEYNSLDFVKACQRNHVHHMTNYYSELASTYEVFKGKEFFDEIWKVFWPHLEVHKTLDKYTEFSVLNNVLCLLSYYIDGEKKEKYQKYHSRFYNETIMNNAELRHYLENVKVTPYYGILHIYDTLAIKNKHELIEDLRDKNMWTFSQDNSTTAGTTTDVSDFDKNLFD